MSNIMAALYLPWAQMILNGRKPFEFRKKPWKQVQIGDKLYLYETKRFGGRGKVVGEATIAELISMEFSPPPEPKTFLYWAKHIAKREDLVRGIEEIESIRVRNYKDGFVYRFALCDPIRKEIIRTHRLPSSYNTFFDRSVYPERYQKITEATRLILQYDEWLRQMGFWNDFGETDYRVAYRLENPIQYSEPKSIHEFCGLDGKPIQAHPQSGIYVL